MTEAPAADLRAAPVLRGVPARAASTPRSPTSPRGSAGSARSPTRPSPGGPSRTPAGSASAAPIAALRRLLYCGEWISSHALHIYLLHAPDFLGYPDVVAWPGTTGRPSSAAWRLKKAGNAILEAVGGRAIHPVNPRVGGFYRAPAAAEPGRRWPGTLRRALDDALATVGLGGRVRASRTWSSSGDLLALHDPDRYADRAATRSRRPAAWSSRPRTSAEHVTEHQVPHSTALHATLDGGTYLTGPLARYALSSARLSPVAREAAAAAGLGPVCRNPFRSIVVRAVETVYAVEEALRIIAAYDRPDPSFVPAEPAAGTGHGAQRGAARPALPPLPARRRRHRSRRPSSSRPRRRTRPRSRPTCAGVVAGQPGPGRRRADRAVRADIRNYDPCISCAAHFLDLRIERR